MTTPTITSLAPLLDRLFDAAEAANGAMRAAVADLSDADRARMMRSKTDYRDLYGRLKEIPLAVSRETGSLLYMLARSSRARTIVEFGTSFGISTIYLAAAVTDNGAGRVFGTEMSAAKLAAAQANLEEAGLADAVTILGGDARESLADVPGPIGLVLLDGWKDLCLPVLRSLEPRLAPGALVVADDITMATMADYLDYVRDPANGYVSVAFPVEDGMEISCRADATT